MMSSISATLVGLMLTSLMLIPLCCLLVVTLSIVLHVIGLISWYSFLKVISNTLSILIYSGGVVIFLWLSMTLTAATTTTINFVFGVIIKGYGVSIAGVLVFFFFRTDGLSVNWFKWTRIRPINTLPTLK